MSCRIRPYTDDDFRSTVDLWCAVSEATYTFMPVLHTRAEDEAYFRGTIVPENDLFLAETEGELVGFLAMQKDLIDRLYVALDHQRRGVGEALLEHARSRAPTFLRLFTHVKNQGARQFYEKHGFEAVRFGTSPPPENEPDVEYHWRP